MNVFVTGGSGTIGSAVIPALRGRGHTVTALARSDDSAAKVEAAGATAVRGELTDSEVLRDAAAAADATIHVGSPGDETSPEVDRVAVAAVQEGAGPEGTYVHTGGIWVYGNTEGEVDEDAPQDPPPLVAWRESLEARLGPMAAPMSLDQQVSNARARTLGWEPRHVNLLASLGRTER